MDASEVSLSSKRSPLDAPACFHGSFYLSPDGRLAGFALRIPAGEDELVWESVSLEPAAAPNRLTGRARLALGHRVITAEVSGLCAELPSRSLKIVLETTFPARSLRWPARTGRSTLRLFTELHPGCAR